MINILICNAKCKNNFYFFNNKAILVYSSYLNYSSKINQIPWHFMLYCKFHFYYWNPFVFGNHRAVYFRQIPRYACHLATDWKNKKSKCHQWFYFYWEIKTVIKYSLADVKISFEFVLDFQMRWYRKPVWNQSSYKSACLTGQLPSVWSSGSMQP